MSGVRISSDQWDELRATGIPSDQKSLGIYTKTNCFQAVAQFNNGTERAIDKVINRPPGGLFSTGASSSISETAPSLAGKEFVRMVVPGISNAISYTSTVVIMRLLPFYLTSALNNVLTNTLTKAIAHTLSSSLTHTLKYNPTQEQLCYNCRALKRDCDKCAVGWKAGETAEFYLNYDAATLATITRCITQGWATQDHRRLR